MYRNKLICRFLMTFFLIGLAVTPVSLAQSNKELIKSEIYVMENILGQLLKASRENWFDGNRVRGVYLNDYGLLFTISLQNVVLSMSFNVEGYLTKSPRPDVPTVRTLEPKDAEEIMERLDKKIRTFMGTYVDVNNHIQPDESVSVLVMLENDWSGVGRKQFYQLPKKTINDYRANRIDEGEFNARINGHKIDNTEEIEEVTIMGTILGTALRGERDFRSSRKVSGVYIDGLGVMYTIGSPTLYEALAIGEIAPADRSDAETAREYAIRVETREKERVEKWKQRIEDYQKKIIKLVGDYGPTLKFLPGDQSIFVLLGTEHGLFMTPGSSKHVMMRIKKDDITRYSQNRINLSDLVKSAQFEDF